MENYCGEKTQTSKKYEHIYTLKNKNFYKGVRGYLFYCLNFLSVTTMLKGVLILLILPHKKYTMKDGGKAGQGRKEKIATRHGTKKHDCARVIWTRNCYSLMFWNSLHNHYHILFLKSLHGTQARYGTRQQFVWHRRGASDTMFIMVCFVGTRFFYFLLLLLRYLKAATVNKNVRVILYKWDKLRAH